MANILNNNDYYLQNNLAEELVLSYPNNVNVLEIEPNVKSVFAKEKFSLKWLLYTLPFIGLITLSLAFNTYNTTTALLLGTSLLGLILSVFIIQEKLGIASKWVSKFCSINSKTSCNSVLKSKKSNINKSIGLSDLSLLFFSISTASILFQTENATITIGYLSLLAIPVVLYTIWIQNFGIKKWCGLCLSVSFVILLQSAILGLENSFLTAFSFTIVSTLLIISLILTSLWFALKPMIENKIFFEKEAEELNKFKRNFNFFQFLSKNIEEYEDFDNLKGITFGNKNATTHISLILNPDAENYHSIFEEAYELYQNYSEKIHLNVLFNLNPNSESNSYKIVAENLIALNEQDPEKAKKALIDWYHNQLSLKNWTRKWSVETPYLLVHKQLQNQYYWCLKNEFTASPVKIVNGNLFPEEYEINELKYFFNNFQEEIEFEEALKAV